jgi:hypothetical protein
MQNGSLAAEQHLPPKGCHQRKQKAFWKAPTAAYSLNKKATADTAAICPKRFSHPANKKEETKHQQQLGM